MKSDPTLASLPFSPTPEAPRHETAFVLSLLQPWASLICWGIKEFETRSWKTPHRGRLYIHASKGLSPVSQEVYQEARRMSVDPSHGPVRVEDLPRGAIIGEVQLLNCDLITADFIRNVSEREQFLGDFTPGRYAWDLASAQTWPNPIPARGSLHIWRWP